MHYGDDTILHSEKNTKIYFFYKGKLIQEHGHRTRSIPNIQFKSIATAPLNSNKTNCRKTRPAARQEKVYNIFVCR